MQIVAGKASDVLPTPWIQTWLFSTKCERMWPTTCRPHSAAAALGLEDDLPSDQPSNWLSQPSHNYMDFFVIVQIQ